jgi:hypothetical protein
MPTTRSSSQQLNRGRIPPVNAEILTDHDSPSPSSLESQGGRNQPRNIRRTRPLAIDSFESDPEPTPSQQSTPTIQEHEVLDTPDADLQSEDEIYVMGPPPVPIGTAAALPARPRGVNTPTIAEGQGATDIEYRLAANKAKEERLIQELQNMKVEQNIRKLEAKLKKKAVGHHSSSSEDEENSSEDNSLAPDHQRKTRLRSESSELTAETRPSKRQRYKLRDPPEYTGANMDSMKAFFEQCERHWTTNPKKWKDHEVRIAYASQFLRGRPAAEWRRRHNEFTHPTWEQFKTVLQEEAAGGSDLQQIATDKLLNAKQGPEQTPVQFLRYIRTLLPDATESMRDKDVVRLKFINGLNPKCHKLFLALPPKHNLGIDEVANYLTRQIGFPADDPWEVKDRQDSYHGRGRHPRNNYRGSTGPNPEAESSQRTRSTNTQDPPRADSSNRREAPDSRGNFPREERISPDEIEERKRLRLCMKCGSSIHFAKECKNGWRKVRVQEQQGRTGEQSNQHAGANSVQDLTRFTDVIPLLTLKTQIMKANREWVQTLAITDDGCQFNAIKRMLVAELGFKPTGQPPKAVNFDGNHLQVYGWVEIQLKITDTNNKVKRTKETFLTVHDAPGDIILGLPFLAKHNPFRGYAEKLLEWTGPTLHNTEPAATTVAPSRRHQLKQLVAGAVVILAGVANEASTAERSDGDDRIDVECNTDTGGVSPGTAEILPEEYHDLLPVFRRADERSLPERGPHDHAIDLEPGKQPPFGVLYPMSAKELDTLREYVNKNLELGIIRHSTSAAASPIMFVPKKDGSLRPVVDYRALNAITIKNRYPLPLIAEALDRLGGATIFTKLDVKDAYNRIRIREGDEWKTAFRTRFGLFEYLVMPFGLTNAPASFQAYINKALSQYLDVCCVVYLDDILIYSQDMRSHVDSVRAILLELQKYGLFVKLSKCEFHQSEVGFLGYKIRAEGVFMEEDRVRSILEWPMPTTLKELQCFLGFANFYRRFIRNYSIIVAPLTDALKTGPMKKGKGKDASVVRSTPEAKRKSTIDGPSAAEGKETSTEVFRRDRKLQDSAINELKVQRQPFQLTERGKEAFHKIKTEFSKAPLLRHFDIEKPIRVETDASGFAIAGILSQQHVTEQEAHWHPVAFWSRKLEPAEQNYGVGEQEMLAIVKSFIHWRHYLEGARHQIVVLTDHANLVWFMTSKELSRRQLRWAEKLAAYDFRVEYRSGKRNPADGPSRRPDYAESDTIDNDTYPTVQKLKRTFDSGTEITNWPTNRDKKGGLNSDALRAAILTRKMTEITEMQKPATPEPLGEAECIGRSRKKSTEKCSDDPDRDTVPTKALALVPSQRNGDSKEQDNPVTDSEGAEHLVEAADDSQENSVGTADAQQLVPPRVPLGAEETVYMGMSPENLIRTIADLQGNDPLAHRVRARLATFVEGSTDSAGENDIDQWHKLWKVDEADRLRYMERIYVPNDGKLRMAVISRYHDDEFAGHFGYARTLELMRRYYYWPGATKEVKEYCKYCLECQKAKPSRHPPYGHLKSLPIPGRPWGTVTMDFITDLPPSLAWNGAVYDSVLVVIDRLTKMAHYIPVRKTIDAPTLAGRFVDEVVRLHGSPDIIVSDRGSVFTSKFWKSFLFYLRARRNLSTAFHPQTDGQTERQNQTLEAYLRVFVNQEQDDWAKLLSIAEFAYNNSIHSATGETPFYANMLRHPKIGIDIVPHDGASQKAKDVAGRLEELHSEMRKRLEEVNKKYAEQFNKHTKEKEYRVGDQVWLNIKNVKVDRPSQKLYWKKAGPYKIIEKVNNHAYRLKIPNQSRIHDVFHISLLEDIKGPRAEKLTDMDLWSGNDAEEWEVEELVRSRMDDDGSLRYEVKWKGYSEDENTWEPAGNLRHCQKLVRKFHKDHPDMPTQHTKPATETIRKGRKGWHRSSRR